MDEIGRRGRTWSVAEGVLIGFYATLLKVFLEERGGVYAAVWFGTLVAVGLSLLGIALTVRGRAALGNEYPLFPQSRGQWVLFCCWGPVTAVGEIMMALAIIYGASLPEFYILSRFCSVMILTFAEKRFFKRSHSAYEWASILLCVLATLVAYAPLVSNSWVESGTVWLGVPVWILFAMGWNVTKNGKQLLARKVTIDLKQVGTVTTWSSVTSLPVVIPLLSGLALYGGPRVAYLPDGFWFGVPLSVSCLFLAVPFRYLALRLRVSSLTQDSIRTATNVVLQYFFLLLLWMTYDGAPPTATTIIGGVLFLVSIWLGLLEPEKKKP